MNSMILIKNGLVVTNDEKGVIENLDIFVKNDRIVSIAKEININDAKIIDATGKVIIPGFVQSHIHLTQTIFRGLADDLELLDWLHRKIWPLEASHSERSNYISAKAGIVELIKSGTTSIVDMGTVNHQNSIFEAIHESGIRAISGKCMMDFEDTVPKGLFEETKDSLKESEQLLRKWHNKDNGRIKYAFAPRFVISCTEKLLKRVEELSRKYGVMIHTHSSENQKEVELVLNRTGLRNIEYFNKLGMTGENLILAHCIWINENEMNILSETGTKVSHCPNSNMKLASGIASIPEMLDRNICVSIGADGAPCNNKLNMFNEMRSTALIHKARLLSPTTMNAETVFKMATKEGAKAMGLEDEIGSIEQGKKADIVIMDLNTIDNCIQNKLKPISTIVYSADNCNVESVIIDGNIVLENNVLKTINEKSFIKDINSFLKNELDETLK